MGTLREDLCIVVRAVNQVGAIGKFSHSSQGQGHHPSSSSVHQGPHTTAPYTVGSLLTGFSYTLKTCQLSHWNNTVTDIWLKFSRSRLGTKPFSDEFDLETSWGGISESRWYVCSYITFKKWLKEHKLNGTGPLTDGCPFLMEIEVK